MISNFMSHRVFARTIKSNNGTKFIQNVFRTKSMNQFHDEKGNRFCLGCKIIIHYGQNGEKHQFREIKSGGGFHSYDAPEAHFGLSKFDIIKKII